MSPQCIKQELTKPTILALYDPAAKSKVSADASFFGLGAVLLQKLRQYAQIEKEAVAVTWSCEKFSNYILRSKFEIETDHKPLVPLLSSKHINESPTTSVAVQIEDGEIRLHYIAHVPGKLLYMADTLSRASAPNKGPDP